jgi:hypothetical protein
MSDLDIKRLGQMDDDVDPRDSNHSHRNLARRNPYGYGRGRSQQAAAEVGHSVTDVWAAACAAQRVNGEYLKADQTVWDAETQAVKIVKRRNRDIMVEFLRNPERITAEDRQAGEQCRAFLQSDLTFRALKGKLTEFDASVSKCLAVEDRFYTVQHRYELAVVACLPNSVTRSQARQEADQRMAFASQGYLAAVGSKVQANVEVLSCNYSQQYGIFWIRGITDDGHAVMFSCKNGHSAKTWLTIQGKVKAHRDNLTQLNYVKVL